MSEECRELNEPVFDADLYVCVRDARAERDTDCVQPQVRATCIKVDLVYKRQAFLGRYA